MNYLQKISPNGPWTDGHQRGISLLCDVLPVRSVSKFSPTNLQKVGDKSKSVGQLSSRLIPPAFDVDRAVVALASAIEAYN